MYLRFSNTLSKIKIKCIAGISSFSFIKYGSKLVKEVRIKISNQQSGLYSDNFKLHFNCFKKRKGVKYYGAKENLSQDLMQSKGSDTLHQN